MCIIIKSLKLIIIIIIKCCISLPLLQMLTINLEESDCFAAWISVTDVPGLEPKVVDGKGVH